MYGVFNPITTMKLKVDQTLLNDRTIVNLVSDGCDLALPAKGLKWTRVFPFGYVPDVTEGANIYITYEVHLEGIGNPAVRRYVLTVNVLAHRDKQRIDDEVGQRLGITDRGVRTDILAARVDECMNGEHGFGFGKLELLDINPFTFAEKFHGQKLIYRVLGWNRSGEKLI